LLEDWGSNLTSTGEAIIDLAYSDPAQTQWLASVYWKGTLGATYVLNTTGPASIVGFAVNKRISGLTSELRDVSITSDLGGVVSYLWDGSDELLDWTLQAVGGTSASIYLSSGFLTCATSSGRGWVVYDQTFALAVLQWGRILQAPAGAPVWFYSGQGGQVHEQLGEHGATANIVGWNASTGDLWMTSQGHRCLVAEVSGNLSHALSGGTWSGAMQVKAGRTSPSVLRLDPSNDVLVACLSGTAIMVDRLIWQGASETYTTDLTETTTGLTGKATGGMYLAPDGQVYLAYVDNNNTLQLATGDLRGSTWLS